MGLGGVGPLAVEVGGAGVPGGGLARGRDDVGARRGEAEAAAATAGAPAGLWSRCGLLGMKESETTTVLLLLHWFL